MIASLLSSAVLVLSIHHDGSIAAPDSAAPFRADSVAAAAAESLADSSAMPKPVLVLPESRVRDSRPLSPPERRVPTGFVTTLYAGERTRALESILDVLAEATGTRIVQYGGLGAFSTVSLRGAPPGQVSVYLDGTPMTSAASSVVNLGDLPFAPIERIEVFRGSSPLSLGGATPGGAIHLVTLSRPEVRDVRVVRGSFGSWEGRASAGVKRGALSGLVHAGYLGSNGDFRYDDDNGTPFNAEDDSVSRRTNNRLDATNGLVRLGFDPGGRFHAVARQHLFHRAGGVSGLGAVPTDNSRASSDRALTQIEFEDRGSRWLPRSQVRASLGRESARFVDARGELGLGRHDARQWFASEQANAELEWPALARWLMLEGAASWRSERADVSDAADGLPEPPRSRRTTRGAMAGVRLRPLGERVLLRAARRWDDLDDRLNVVALGGAIQQTHVPRLVNSPQIGATLRPLAGLELRANWADAARPPDFLELFGNQGAVLGNPALLEERSENWDAGARIDARAVSGRRAGFQATLEYAHFVSHARDLILYVRSSPSSVKAQNIASARIEGDEFTFRLATPWGVSASANATLEDALDTGPVAAWNGKRLPQRPALEATGRLEWKGPRLRLAADVHHLGDNYLDRFNRYRESNRTLLGVAMSVAPFSAPLRFTLEGKNLADRHTADVGGFPLPGRSLWAALEWHLAPNAAPSEASRP